MTWQLCKPLVGTVPVLCAVADRAHIANRSPWKGPGHPFGEVHRSGRSRSWQQTRGRERQQTCAGTGNAATALVSLRCSVFLKLSTLINY